jgi:hypothetical protein
VRRSVSRWTRLLAGALAVLVASALSASPSFAAGPAVAPPAAINLRAAVAKLATPDATAAARLSQEPTKDAAGSSENRSFVHSSKGVVAVLLLAGGLTWAIASRSKDAVHSPGRN